eukprot:7391469-Prymnesium_polylepis.1
MRWTLVQEYADVVERRRNAVAKLAVIEGRLLRSPPMPCALAARRAISNLEEHQLLSFEYIADTGLRRPQLNLRPFLLAAMGQIDPWERRWLVRVWICQVKAVLSPLASIAIQGAYRGSLRRKRAVRAIQGAVYRHLYRPRGWAHQQSVIGLADVLQMS